MEGNRKLKSLYIGVNTALIAAIIILLIRVGDKTAESYMAMLAACGAFAAFNGYWSINRSLYSWFHRDRQSGANNFRTLIVAGTLLIALCIVWLFI